MTEKEIESLRWRDKVHCNVIDRMAAEIDRLRSSASHISDDGNTLADAAEIEQLREAIRRLADQDATLSVCDGNVTVTLDATLTDAEREAIVWCVELLDELDSSKGDTLRNLLERLA